MTPRIKNYLLLLIQKKKKGLASDFILLLLWGCSFFYGLYIFIIRRFYRLPIISRKKRLNLPVVSIGNITVGGTGKIPLIRYLANYYQKQGLKPLILLRGYGGFLQEDAAIVSQGEAILLDARVAGEEAVVMARQLPGVPIVISKNSILGGEYAQRNFKADVLIIDDAFQDFKLKRNLDIVALDAVNPFGYNYLLPRGFLRESPKVLKYAQIISLNKIEQVPAQRLEKLRLKMTKLTGKALLIETIQKPVFIRDISGQEDKDLNLNGEKVLAFSAIGNPASFEATLLKLGAELVGKLRFPDHHTYSEEEVLQIFSVAIRKKADLIITTEKDIRSLPPKINKLVSGQKMTLWMLGIELEIVKGQAEFATKLKTIKGGLF